MSAARLERLDVVVPAHDEEATVVDCLRSLLRARDRLLGARPDLSCRIVLVLDACTDRTAELAAGFGARIATRAVTHRSVGAARRAGVELALRPGTRQWLAQTDADSTVPEHWLERHAEAAEQGAEVLLGGVRPTFERFSAPQRHAWLRSLAEQPAGAVYGANLGIDAALYRRIGGYAPLREHEDVDLVRRARAAGARIDADCALTVSTSDRRTGRTPGGFAGFLRTAYPLEA